MTSAVYDQTKDSGIDWLGHIPDTWRVLRVKQVFERKNSKSKNDEPVVLSLARAGVKTRDISNNEGQLAESYFNYNPVEPGDILLNPMDLQSGANCSISEVSGVISPAYVNLRAISDYDPRFYDYYFKLQYWSRAFFAHGRGVSYDNRWTLNTETIMNYPVIVPPSKLQKNIANFLDMEIVKIDNLINTQEKLIKLIDEKQQANINRAVTRGLSSAVEFKDTGVEWLGRIPAHWEVLKARYLFREFNSRSIDGEETHLSMSQKLGLVPSSQVQSSLTSESYAGGKLCEKEDLVLNRLKAHLGVFAIAKQAGVISPDYTVLRKTRNVSMDYYENLLKSPLCRGELFVRTRGIVEGFWRLYTKDFYEIMLPLPPKEEQEKIVEFIRAENKIIHQLKKLAEKQISLLLERRISLISSAISGKIKV